jgi:hypothetical protein
MSEYCVLGSSTIASKASCASLELRPALLSRSNSVVANFPLSSRMPLYRIDSSEQRYPFTKRSSRSVISITGHFRSWKTKCSPVPSFAVSNVDLVEDTELVDRKASFAGAGLWSSPGKNFADFFFLIFNRELS